MEKFNLDNILPYENNGKIHSDEQLKKIAGSLKQFGWQQPIKVGADYKIIVGHGRFLAYKKYPKGIKTPWIINEAGETINGEPEKRVLTKEEEIAYRLTDNKLNESPWSMELVNMDIKLINEDLLKITGFEDIDLKESGDVKLDDDKYTKKINTPTYDPKNEKPEITALYDIQKTLSLIEEIKKADVTQDEKEFLIYSAHRMNVFNYKLIADYYAHAEKPMQEIMEKLALVIIDFEKAIENGYAVLSNELLTDYNENTYDEE